MAEINISLHLQLGRRLLKVGDKVLGECDGVALEVEEATPEEVIAVLNAPEIKLIKPDQGKVIVEDDSV